MVYQLHFRLRHSGQTASQKNHRRIIARTASAKKIAMYNIFLLTQVMKKQGSPFLAQPSWGPGLFSGSHGYSELFRRIFSVLEEASANRNPLHPGTGEDDVWNRL